MEEKIKERIAELGKAKENYIGQIKAADEEMQRLDNKKILLIGQVNACNGAMQELEKLISYTQEKK